MEEEFKNQEERLEYLRSRGVEIDLVRDMSSSSKQERPEVEKSDENAKYFQYVYVPSDIDKPITVERCLRDFREGDSLKEWLRPRFADAAPIDSETAERETRAQLENMVATSGFTAPSTSTIQKVAAESGSVEAYPLARGEDEYVHLYIDEVGTLRQRPRNARAEKLASTVGLSGLRIHGDAYVGRTMPTAPFGVENLDFVMQDMEPTSAWIKEARRSHSSQYEAMPNTDLKSGSTSQYDWSQTQEDVEVSIACDKPIDKKKVKVDYGKAGSSLFVDVDGDKNVAIPRLFDRISIDDSSWTIDQQRLVISMEKVEHRVWDALEL